MAHARLEIIDDRLKIVKPGQHKFIHTVSEITMSGKQALKKGKTVLHVTNVGVFKLTERGMMLIEVMPGIDIQKDILESCPMKVELPESSKVAVTDSSIVTGNGFALRWGVVY